MSPSTHRRSATLSSLPPPPPLSMRAGHRSGETMKRNTSSTNARAATRAVVNPLDQPSWRTRRANSHHDARPMQKDWATTKMTNVDVIVPTTNKQRSIRPDTLPALPANCLEAVAAPIPARDESTRKKRTGKADKIDNWRVKPSPATLPKPSPPVSITVTDEPTPRSTKSDEASAATVPEMLPPIRVSMQPAPVEVLPPLRFSMDPAIRGRSAWRFVLPSPVREEGKEQIDEYTGDLIDDLPHWFIGKESDIVVRLGSSVQRPLSPSARSSSSSGSSSSSSSSQHEGTSPSLDYSDDGSSSGSSSATASPEVRQLELFPEHAPYFIDELDTSNVKTPLATQHFSVPSLAASAPSPSHLPLPSFLMRGK